MSLEQFNTHQQDVRARTDSLARAVFVLSGGALSISIGIFVKVNNLSECAVSVLKLSWWSLTFTIISLVIMLSIVICRDYFFGERWRAQRNGKIENAEKDNTIVDTFVWMFAILGLLGFLVGYISLAYVATSAISQT